MDNIIKDKREYIKAFKCLKIKPTSSITEIKNAYEKNLNLYTRRTNHNAKIGDLMYYYKFLKENISNIDAFFKKNEIVYKPEYQPSTFLSKIKIVEKKPKNEYIGVEQIKRQAKPVTKSKQTASESKKQENTTFFQRCGILLLILGRILAVIYGASVIPAVVFTLWWVFSFITPSSTIFQYWMYLFVFLLAGAILVLSVLCIFSFFSGFIFNNKYNILHNLDIFAVMTLGFSKAFTVKLKPKIKKRSNFSKTKLKKIKKPFSRKKMMIVLIILVSCICVGVGIYFIVYFSIHPIIRIPVGVPE